jgi:hypothetical protein
MANIIAHRDMTATDGAPFELRRGDAPYRIEIGAAGAVITVVHDADAGDAVKAWRTLVRKSVQRGLDRPDYPELTRYTVRYTDGTSLPIVVRWGEGVEAALRRTFEMESRWLGDLAWATIESLQSFDYEADAWRVRYRMYWPNPYPEREIETIELAGPGDEGAALRVWTVALEAGGHGDATTGVGATATAREGATTAAPLETRFGGWTVGADELGEAAKRAGVSSLAGVRHGLPGSGAVYYVAPAGDDAADGSFDHPWATPAKAAATAKAGDTVYFRGGTYRPTDPVVPHHSGSEGEWIAFCGWPGETPLVLGHDIHIQPGSDEFLIDNGRTVATMPTGTGVFHIYDRSWIRVKGLVIRDAPYSAIGVDARPYWKHDYEPDRFDGSHHIDLLYNRIERTVNAGIGLYGEDAGEPDRPGEPPARRDQALHPHSYAVGEGIPIDYVRVIGNQLLNTWDSEWTLATTDPGAQASLRQAHRERDRFGDECLDLQRVHHFEVAYNEVGWGGKEGIDLMNGTAFGRAHHNYIHDTFVHEWFPGGKIGIYLDPRLGGEHLEVDHNVVERAGTGIRICNESGAPYHHYRIHHNLALHNRHIGIDVRAKGIWGERIGHDIEVSNNTVYRNGLATPYGAAGGGCGISIRGGRGLHDVVVRNNVSVDNESWQYALQRGVDRVAHRIVMDYNLSWPATMTMTTARPTGDHPAIGDLPVIGDPAFFDPAEYNYGLRRESAALESGHPEWTAPDGARSHLGAVPRPNRLPAIPYLADPPAVSADLAGWERVASCFAGHTGDDELVRLCWNESGLYGAVVCRERDAGKPIDGFYHPDAVLLAVQTRGEPGREQNGDTFRWVMQVDEDDRVVVHQNRPRVLARRRHYWDATEEPRAADHVELEPPAGTKAAGRRTGNGYRIGFFFPAAALATAGLSAGLELAAYLCVTNGEARVVEYGERATPAIERIWLSPERWGKVRFAPPS